MDELFYEIDDPETLPEEQEEMTEDDPSPQES